MPTKQKRRALGRIERYILDQVAGTSIVWAVVGDLAWCYCYGDDKDARRVKIEAAELGLPHERAERILAEREGRGARTVPRPTAESFKRAAHRLDKEKHKIRVCRWCWGGASALGCRWRQHHKHRGRDRVRTQRLMEGARGKGESLRTHWRRDRIERIDKEVGLPRSLIEDLAFQRVSVARAEREAVAVMHEVQTLAARENVADRARLNGVPEGEIPAEPPKRPIEQ